MNQRLLGLIGLLAISALTSCEAENTADVESSFHTIADTGNTGTGSDDPEK